VLRPDLDDSAGAPCRAVLRPDLDDSAGAPCRSGIASPVRPAAPGIPPPDATLRAAEGVSNVKVRNSVRALKAKDGSYVVRRRGRIFVLNKRNHRVKARQG
jgi:large subunit ribosomal protein L36